MSKVKATLVSEKPALSQEKIIEALKEAHDLAVKSRQNFLAAYYKQRLDLLGLYIKQ